MRYCPQCTCNDENACLTTKGACAWVPGTDLCSACFFPATFLAGPHLDDARTVAADGPLSIDTLCRDARTNDGDSVRWFWGVYGRELRMRLEAAVRSLSVLAA